MGKATTNAVAKAGKSMPMSKDKRNMPSQTKAVSASSKEKPLSA